MADKKEDKPDKKRSSSKDKDRGAISQKSDGIALTDKKPESVAKDKSSSRKSEGMPLEGEKKDKKSEGHRDKHEHSSKKPSPSETKTESTKADTKHHSKDKTESKDKHSDKHSSSTPKAESTTTATTATTASDKPPVTEKSTKSSHHHDKDKHSHHHDKKERSKKPASADHGGIDMFDMSMMGMQFEDGVDALAQLVDGDFIRSFEDDFNDEDLD